ncbi:MAG TPA: peptide ABC transporter substrate-binding protein [Ktedonobacterales bacterium]|nr:peptide ABC transporter substrate-binding protein [Ktedonobacterales bacterium]
MSRWAAGLAPVVVAMAVLAGCTPGFAPASNNMAPLAQQVLNYQLVTGASDIAGLDPGASFADLKETGLSAHAASLLPISLVFSNLVTLDQNLAVENWDAQHIAVSADGLTYTFTLRDDLKFSDGKAVTAADYAFAINRTLDPCLASAVAPYLYEIKDALTFNAERCTIGAGGAPNTYDTGYGQTTPVLKDLLHDSVVASDPKTLVVTLAAPASYFLAAFAYPAAAAIEQSVVGNGASDSKWTDTLSKGATGQGGSGPYYVSSWNHKGALVLKANPNFRTKPHIQTINISIYADAASAYKAYTSGTTDIGYPPVASLAQVRGQADYHQHPALWTNYLGLNWQQAPFDDVRARQAFALALNKDQINTDALSGAQLPTNHLIPSGMPGYNSALVGPDGVASTQGDATKAKALWQDYVKDKCGGQASNCAPVTLTYSSSSVTADAVSKRMAQMWKAVLGVDVTLKTVEFDTLLGQLATDSLQFWNIGWRAYYPDPQNWLSLQFLCCPEAAYNAGHVSLADANTLLAQADANLDQTQRLKQYQSAEQKLVDQVGWVPYDQVMNHWQNRTWIHGYGETAQGQPSLDQWLAMYITNH